MIDPPSGWKYGFPKEIPEHVDNTVQWLIENGYPESEVKRLGENFYVRGWWEEKHEYEICSLEKAEEFAKKRKLNE
jgi:cyclophilin family peptidyl-prolyl cis-trans isomerase